MNRRTLVRSKSYKISASPKIEINVGSIHQGMPFCMHKDNILNVKSQ